MKLKTAKLIVYIEMYILISLVCIKLLLGVTQ